MSQINYMSTKEEFLQKYVLNRAKTSLNLNGTGAAEEAIKAWNKIKKEINKPNDLDRLS
jgi:hypothetical protein